MDIRAEQITSTLDALKKLWISVPEASWPQLTRFIDEHGDEASSHEDWLKVISSQSRKRLREYVKSEEAFLLRLKELHAREPELPAGGKRGLGIGLLACFKDDEGESNPAKDKGSVSG